MPFQRIEQGRSSPDALFRVCCKLLVNRAFQPSRKQLRQTLLTVQISTGHSTPGRLSSCLNTPGRLISANRRTVAFGRSTLVLITLLLACPASSASNWWAPSDAGPECKSQLDVESGRVLRISDGDTIVLSDNRKVRLIGINTLELNEPERKHRSVAENAKNALSQWLPAGESVLLHVGSESHDRHNRLLAHVVRQSDQLAVAHALLEQGYAFQSAVAPNTKCAGYFAQLENVARKHHRGIWQMTTSLSTPAASIGRKSRGFKFINGTVTKIHVTNKHTILTLDNRLPVMVRGKLADALQANNLLQQLGGKKVEVRGWLSRRQNRVRLWLQHPANLRVMAE